MKEATKKRGRPVASKNAVADIKKSSCPCCERDKVIAEMRNSFTAHRSIIEKRMEHLNGKVDCYGQQTKEVRDTLDALRETARSNVSYTKRISEWLIKKGIMSPE